MRCASPREDGRDPVRCGEEGEIQARGIECFVGYADAALNRACFSDDGWFRTGDLGVVDGAGYVTVTGRIKEIVIRKGEKISIREVEEVLVSHPAIREACVAAVADPEVGERIGAAVVLERDAELGREELIDHLRDRGLSTRKLPERIAFVREIPHTESGKAHRAAVGRMLEESSEAEPD